MPAKVSDAHAPGDQVPVPAKVSDAHAPGDQSPISAPRDAPSYPELSKVAFAAVRERASTPPGESNGSLLCGEERRSDPRIPCELNVEFEDDTQFFAGLSLDVSRGGFIATYRLLPIGTLVGLRFTLRRGGAEIRARGQVRWVRETATTEGRPGIGVSFTDIAPDAVAAIEAFSTIRPPLVFDEEDWT